jgi:hypothetical protein
MRTFKARSLYTRSLPSVFQQAQFATFEDTILEQTNPISPMQNFPQLTLAFSTPAEVSRYELSRVLYVFKRVFNTKPEVIPTRQGGYRVKATFAPRFAHHLLSFFLHMKRYGNTKYLKFFFVEGSLDFSFLLFEPITFFPLVHPAFDYYDWSYPFEFTVNFSKAAHNDYLDEIVADVFNI